MTKVRLYTVKNLEIQKCAKKKYLSANCNKALNIFLEFTKYKTRGQFFYFQDTVIVRKLHFSKEIDLLFKK